MAKAGSDPGRLSGTKRKPAELALEGGNAPKCWKTAAQDLGLDVHEVETELKGLRESKGSVGDAWAALKARKCPTQAQWTDLMRETLDPTELTRIGALFGLLEPDPGSFPVLRWAAKCWGFVYPWERFRAVDIAAMVAELAGLPVMHPLDLWIMSLVQNDFVPAASLGFPVDTWKKTPHYATLKRIQRRYLASGRHGSLKESYLWSAFKEDKSRAELKLVAKYKACDHSLDHKICTQRDNVAAVCAGSFILSSVQESLGLASFVPGDIDIFLSLPTVDYVRTLFFGRDLPQITVTRKDYSVINVCDPDIKGSFGTPEIQFVLTRSKKLASMVAAFDAAVLQVFYDMHTDTLYARPSALWQIVTKNMSLWWVHPKPARFDKYSSRQLFLPRREHVVAELVFREPSLSPLMSEMMLWDPDKSDRKREYDGMDDKARWSTLINPSNAGPLPNNLQVLMCVVERREVPLFKGTSCAFLRVFRNELTDRLLSLYPRHLDDAPELKDSAFAWLPVSVLCDSQGGRPRQHRALTPFSRCSDAVLPCWCVLNIAVVTMAKDRNAFLYPNQHGGPPLISGTRKYDRAVPPRPCVLHIVPLLTNQNITKIHM